MPEIGQPGSERGGEETCPRVPDCGPARKRRTSHRNPYRLRASPRLYTDLVGTLAGGRGAGGRRRQGRGGHRAAEAPGGGEADARALTRRVVLAMIKRPAAAGLPALDPLWGGATK